SPILGSWLLLGHGDTWTPHHDVAPALVARQSVTVAPHTWWRLLALQGAPAAPLVLVCILLATVAAGGMLAALWLTRGEQTAHAWLKDGYTCHRGIRCHRGHKCWEQMEV